LHATTCKSPAAREITRGRGAPKEGAMLLPKWQREGFAKDSRRSWWENRRDSASSESAESPTCAGNSHSSFYEVRGAAGRHFPQLAGEAHTKLPWCGQALQPQVRGTVVSRAPGRHTCLPGARAREKGQHCFHKKCNICFIKTKKALCSST